MSTRQLFTRNDAGQRRSGPVVMVRQFAPDMGGQAAGAVRLREYADKRFGLSHEAPGDVAVWCGSGAPLAPVAALAVVFVPGAPTAMERGAQRAYVAPSIDPDHETVAAVYERCSKHGMVRTVEGTTNGEYLCPHGCGVIRWPQATGDVECAGHIPAAVVHRGACFSRRAGKLARDASGRTVAAEPDAPIVRHPQAMPVRTWRTVGPLCPIEGRIVEDAEAATRRVALANTVEHLRAYQGTTTGVCGVCGRASCRALLNTRRPCPFTGKGRVAPAAVKASAPSEAPRPMLRSGDMAHGYVDDVTDRWEPRVKA